MVRIFLGLFVVAALLHACGSGDDSPRSKTASAASSAFSCSETQLQASHKVMDMISEMATVTFDSKKKVVVVQWGRDWDSANSTQRQGLIETYANADACLNRGARDIEFYRSANLVGTADYRGIKAY